MKTHLNTLFKLNNKQYFSKRRSHYIQYSKIMHQYFEDIYLANLYKDIDSF